VNLFDRIARLLFSEPKPEPAAAPESAVVDLVAPAKSATVTEATAPPDCAPPHWQVIGGGGRRCADCGVQQVEAVAVGISRKQLFDGDYRVCRFAINPEPFQKAMAKLIMLSRPR
jgi:hypothetical protein